MQAQAYCLDDRSVSLPMMAIKCAAPPLGRYMFNDFRPDLWNRLFYCLARSDAWWTQAERQGSGEFCKGEHKSIDFKSPFRHLCFYLRVSQARVEALEKAASENVKTVRAAKIAAEPSGFQGTTPEDVSDGQQQLVIPSTLSICRNVELIHHLFPRRRRSKGWMAHCRSPGSSCMSASLRSKTSRWDNSQTTLINLINIPCRDPSRKLKRCFYSQAMNDVLAMQSSSPRGFYHFKTLSMSLYQRVFMRRAQHAADIYTCLRVWKAKHATQHTFWNDFLLFLARLACEGWSNRSEQGKGVVFSISHLANKP